LLKEKPSECLMSVGQAKEERVWVGLTSRKVFPFG